MTRIKILERDSTLIHLAGRSIPDKKIMDAYHEACDYIALQCPDLVSVGENGVEAPRDIHMIYERNTSTKETIIYLYPCRYSCEVAYSPNFDKIKTNEREQRRRVYSCNISFNRELFPMGDKNVIDVLWMPIKKEFSKCLTMIPFTDCENPQRKRWQILCDSRVPPDKSEEYVRRSARRLMDTIAIAVRGVDVEKAPKEVRYLEQVSGRLAYNLLNARH